jgi:glycine betaine catabolism B
MIKASSYIFQFLRKEQRAKDTFSFYFDRSQTNFTFLPGQYLRLTLPHNSDDRGTSRFFTISSSPLNKEIMITAKILQSSFKEKLFSLQSGDEVHVFGPMGRFIFDESNAAEHVFIAGGIGVTPFHSMVTYAAAKKLSHKMTLFAMFSRREDIIFQDVLTTIAEKMPSMQIIYSLTRKDPTWKGETGRFSKMLLTTYVKHHDKILYSVVGSPEMAASTRELLLSLNIPEEQIRSEGFTGY